MPARSISAKELRADCQLLESVVLAATPTTKESLATHRPGGEGNPTTDARAWLTYYRHLQRTHAVATASGAGANGPSRQLADGELLDALRSEPIPVVLVGATADQAPLFVHAKSLDALMHVHALDQQLGWMTAQHAALLKAASPEAMDHLSAVLGAIAYTYHLLCWIVTTPGPGLPYASDDDRPEPPPHIRALEPWDVTRICTAHHKHMGRLAALSTLIEPRRADESGGSRPSWSSFIATMELETGQAAEHLMKFRALASLLAAARLGTAARAGDGGDVDRAGSGA